MNIIRNDDPAADERWLTIEELSEKFGHTRQTLAHWRSKGIGPGYVKIGRKIRYPVRLVEEWLAGAVHTPVVGATITKRTDERSESKDLSAQRPKRGSVHRGSSVKAESLRQRPASATDKGKRLVNRIPIGFDLWYRRNT